jgi:site-specific DNA recombinase
MAFRTAPRIDPVAPKRVALYLRVSTGRQAAGDVSIPSQRDLTRRYCEAQGWIVTEEFIEPGASATDDRRPVFQRMLDQAASAERRFDVICVHSFSRFYRDGAEMELCIRKLRKLGVEVVSITQPTGDDPSQQLMRQIIGIFDEYTSRENGRNVTRAMRESAKQGFWNGATPPLGYRIVEAERRGSKIKKRLAIDPVEAELVHLIFRLYNEGHGRSGPLGVKGTTKWLNEYGYRTRRGSTFGIGPVHKILSNRCYATGKWPYGRRNSRTGAMHDPSTIVEIQVPTIIPLELFEKAQARLAHNNPKVTPPRVVNGPTLLTGLAVCASCGAGMTRTGTRRRGQSYSYYSCGGCQRKGKTVCPGRHVPMGKLDELIVDNIKQTLLTPRRLTDILRTLLGRQADKDRAVQGRRAALKAELASKEEKLKRLYRALRSVISQIEVDDDRIRIIGDKATLAAVIAGRQTQQANVHGFVRKWRARRDSNP